MGRHPNQLLGNALNPITQKMECLLIPISFFYFPSLMKGNGEEVGFLSARSY
jgi:hypothetical protein